MQCADLAKRSEAGPEPIFQRRAKRAAPRRQAGVWGRQPPAGSRGRAPVGVQGAKPPKNFMNLLYILYIYMLRD